MSGIWKIENVFCDDKKLADVLRALAGKCLGNPQPVPVINAEKTTKKSGELKQKTSGNLLDLFSIWLKDKNITELRTMDTKAFLKDHGRAPNSCGYLVKLAVRAHMLKKKGNGANTSYLVTKEI